jgi:hypothetical protein
VYIQREPTLKTEEKIMRYLNKTFQLVLVLACLMFLIGTPGGRTLPTRAAPAPGVLAASIIRVTTAGATSGACGSTWGSACGLQHALNDIAVSDDEIWVGTGTYKPTTGSDRNATFALKSGVALYGGFAMTETLRSQRNWTANVTILSGEIGVAGNSDNSYHVVTADSVDATAILDGFTVTGGNANGSGADEGTGGGVFSYYGSPMIQNVILSNNSASGVGGGMFNDHSSPTLTGTTFDGNTSGSAGGGVSNSYSHPTLTGVTFSANSVIGSNSTGGGMYNDYSSPALRNVTFNGNSTTGGNGGAMYNDLVSAPVLTNVTFYNNSAIMNSGFNGGYGGAVYDYSNTPPPQMTNVTFRDNYAVGYDGDHPGYGGALYILGGAIGITNTILWGNTPDQVYNDSTPTTVINTSIVQGGCPTDSTCSGIVTADPLLGALGNYGGSVQTIPLLPASSAIDTARDASCPAADARGVSRPQGAHCDIGAFESSRFTLGITGGNNQSTLINTAFAQPLQVSVIANNASEPVNGGKVTFTPPASGASASLATSPATIASGSASVNAIANGVRGSYLVTATMAGASNSVSFGLRNLSPTVFYVKPGASGDCAAWGTACELQTALGQATYGDEIWIAAGTYKPTTGSDPNATFVLTNGVGVYGGFAGTETARNQRNWTTNVVTLSGNLSGTAHSLHVVTAHGTDSKTLLDGLTITGGRGTGAAGGGVFIDSNGSLTIANCRIADNSADYGGGLFQGSNSGRVVISNSRVELNTTSNHGGGLYVGGNVTMTDTQVLSNTAIEHGGGLHVNSGDTNLVGGLFRNNRTSNGNGGGVNLNANVSVSGTQFISNTAGGSGGGLLQWNANYTVTVTSAHFEHNTAGAEGGALWMRGNATATNLVMIDNAANAHGSGVLLMGSTSHFLQATIARNGGGEGSGISVVNDGTRYSTLALTNTILVSQTVGISVTTGNTATLNGVLWFGNGVNTGGAGSFNVQNATTGDPAFAADGYHLTSRSVAIDHGVNSGVTTDIDGDPRPMGAGYDLGADEFRFTIYLPLVIRN